MCSASIALPKTSIGRSAPSSVKAYPFRTGISQAQDHQLQGRLAAAPHCGPLCADCVEKLCSTTKLPHGENPFSENTARGMKFAPISPYEKKF
jgi:hypothetical protein